MMYIRNPMMDDHSMTSVEALIFCDMAYITKAQFVDVIAEQEAVKEAFTKLAVAKVVDAKRKNTRKSYATIPVMLDENGDLRETVGNGKQTNIQSTSIREQKNRDSLSEKIGAGLAPNSLLHGTSAGLPHGFPRTKSSHHLSDESLAEDSTEMLREEMEKATASIRAGRAEGADLSRRLGALEQKLDAEMASVHSTLGLIAAAVEALAPTSPLRFASAEVPRARRRNNTIGNFEIGDMVESADSEATPLPEPPSPPPASHGD